jgi:hypothetical protein
VLPTEPRRTISEPRRTIPEPRRTILSHAAPYWATPHHIWATPHHTEPPRTMTEPHRTIILDPDKLKFNTVGTIITGKPLGVSLPSFYSIIFPLLTTLLVKMWRQQGAYRYMGWADGEPHATDFLAAHATLKQTPPFFVSKRWNQF